ncbi:hypothetical protein [Planomicrobium okeanokoites]|uniref:hypothetical protein n=1 Tax=Planomicrobium okeanokoites TaxID=244 RepID=UPI002491D8B7|nr:hypothetical protein [Planomicrobium okeanokoites]
MTSYTMKVFTLNQIHSEIVGKKFLAILEKNHFTPEKMGTYEPLRKEFSAPEFINLWTEESEGCYEENVGMVGKAGGIMARRKSPYFYVLMNWWLCPGKSNLNHISFIFTAKTMRNHRAEVLNVFQETVELVNGVYGYITHEEPEERQHVTGTLYTRIPGVFWCNYYGDIYMNFFGKKLITSYSWFRAETVSNGLLTFLSENPDELIKDNFLELKAQEYLGIDSFGDQAEHQKDPFTTQVRSVPKI